MPLCSRSKTSPRWRHDVVGLMMSAPTEVGGGLQRGRDAVGHTEPHCRLNVHTYFSRRSCPCRAIYVLGLFTSCWKGLGA